MGLAREKKNEKSNKNSEQERAERRAGHLRRRRWRQIIVITILLAISSVAAFLFHDYYSSDVYKNAEEFEEFAHTNMSSRCVSPVSAEAETKYSYAKSKSTAIRRDTIYYSGNALAGIESNVGESRQEPNAKAYDVIDRYRQFKIDGILLEYEDKPGAVLIDAILYESSNGAFSLVVYSQFHQEKDKQMVLVEEKVDSYLFNAETGRIAEPVFLLQPHYRKAVSAYALDYFSKNSTKKLLNENWESQLADNESNFNQFIMIGNRLVFIFDPGTIEKKNQGVLIMAMDEEDIGAYIRPQIIERYIDPNKPMVALTYDDGPGGESEKRILQTLATNNSVATFFYVGNRIANYPDTAREAITIGCEIGNHTWNHPQLSKLSRKEIVSQLEDTNEQIKKYCGVIPDVARPPYGDYDQSVLEESGMAQILWQVDTLDWKHRDPDQTFKTIKNTKKLDGKIILMHSIHDETADATEKIVPWLKKKGYQLVTVSELIKYRTGAPPKAGELYR